MLCLALTIAVTGCGGSSDSSSSSVESSAATESTESSEASPTSEKAKPVATDKTKPKVTVPKGIDPEKFVTRDLEKGTGASVKSGDKATIHYVVVGYNSKREVESTWSQGPYTFTVGSGEVLKGGELGIQGMKVGGRREMIIPGNLAYGPAGRAPTIGSNETLIFVVDLLAVE
ncbi:MAG TPA: FKBP-type peptidyl-prolyl cis-trans isomerase [Solirubrobacterales bacterium]|nr:FKBP-type peptidyl-prolyl cis-trans isomerase [Solirubrobacterales bacterium]